ncbi:hypothetical protein AncyloWKF20_14540 [Ancylobacter sp. WKF20]|uniref:hypothetical protein n=1 Tax=Ancylobacter sp. WKF20 TaxID=3039801 RepID=UPI0024345ED3|nr:hypothetical protein [Ancylobacter sp. WKF20]WGD28999.1 hypothetical protein AncyloWKF20_14540 [Ancylobacter sp. WKF20]
MNQAPSRAPIDPPAPARAGAPLNITVRPGWNSQNPFTIMFAEALAAQGNTVGDRIGGVRFYPFGADVIVLHWPDEYFFVRSLKATARAFLFLLAKWLLGAKLIWVVHNIEPHDKDKPPFPTGRRALFAAIDGLVFLSETSRTLLYQRWPELKAKPFTVVSHGHYKGRAIAPMTAPRAVSEPVRLAYIGQLRPYKSADTLIELVRALPPESVTLKVGGNCPDKGFAQRLRQFAEGAPNVALSLGLLSDSEIEQQVDGADAVILPYRDILNSGSAIYALSRARPVLAPRLGSLIELQQQVGANWLYLYEGEFNAEVLASFIAWLKAPGREGEPDLSSHEWEPIGRQLDGFFRQLKAR